MKGNGYISVGNI